MNCKPGDLAVIRGISHPEYEKNNGHFVEVIRAVKFAYWEIKALSPLIGYYSEIQSGELCHCEDQYLRPIRDQEGEDEMIRIAGKPVKETT